MNKTSFSKTKRPGFSFPYLFFWFVYGRASFPGYKQHTKVLVWIFFSAIRTHNKIAEIRPKFYKFRKRIALVCTKFLKNSPWIVFSWNSTQESLLNLVQNTTNFRSNGWVFTREKNQKVSHTDESSFQPWQWRIKNLLPFLWDESEAQT